MLRRSGGKKPVRNVLEEVEKQQQQPQQQQQQQQTQTTSMQLSHLPKKKSGAAVAVSNTTMATTTAPAPPPTPQQQLAAVPLELVVRSLRRRFWRALQQEDAKQALRIYQATRRDWESMLLEEAVSISNTTTGGGVVVAASTPEEKEKGNSGTLSSSSSSSSCVVALQRRRSLASPSKRKQQQQQQQQQNSAAPLLLTNIPVLTTMAELKKQQQRPGWLLGGSSASGSRQRPTTTTTTTTTTSASAVESSSFHFDSTLPSFSLVMEEEEEEEKERHHNGLFEKSNNSNNNNNNNSSIIILPQILKPCDFFIEDDFQPFVGPYLETNYTSNNVVNNNNNNNNNRESGIRSGSGSWFRCTAPASSSLSTTLAEEQWMKKMRLLLRVPQDPSCQTTPLHEAARIGSGELVRCLLEWAVNGGTAAAASAASAAFADHHHNHHHRCLDDIHLRNGLGRTPLHCVAGGLTREEATRVSYQDQLAILAPQPHRGEGNEQQHQQQQQRSSSALRFGTRPLFRVSSRSKKQHRDRNSSGASSENQHQQHQQQVSNDRIDRLATDRMDAVMALLTCDASSNAVDQTGRTPLHYAAALGRTDISFALFNLFGTLLTVVDGFGRTPAEWAALHGHATLAAQLEARALLYMDPLEMDLLESLLDENNNNNNNNNPQNSSSSEQNRRSSSLTTALSPPFSWFTTFETDRVQKEREFRVRTTLTRMRKILERWNRGRSGRDLLYKSSSCHSRDSTRNEAVTTQSSSISNTSSSSSSPSSPIPGQDLTSLDGLNEGSVAEFLIHHEWDVKQALAAFYEDPIGSISQAKISLTQIRSPVMKNNNNNNGPQQCMICFEEFDVAADGDMGNWRDLNCGHGFCVACLGDYIASCAKSRESGLAVRCPHQTCSVAMSLAEVSDLTPSEEIKATLTETANNNFVVQAKDFRFCPHPGCTNAVKFIPPKNKPAELHDIMSSSGAVCTSSESFAKRKENSPFITYEGIYDEPYFDCHSRVEPRRAHRFCFHCGEGAHWPVSCSCLEQWKAKVEENVKNAEVKEGDDYNEVSHKLWLKANTRPCPKCKVPIEKNDGCNHMTCSNPACKHEFCWICRNDWSLHGTSTGGFFRCNRWAEEGESHQYYDTTTAAPSSSDLLSMRNPTEEDLSDPRRMGAIYGTAVHESRIAHKRSREMARFLHHYQRFSAHADSAKLEAKMADTSAERMRPIVEAAVDISGDPAFNFGGKGLSFVFDAFTELRECRSVLQHSYAFSYFRYAKGIGGGRSFSQMMARRINTEGLQFEQIQSDLEMITEQMSDLVARSHMRATQSQILYLTLTAAQKRRDFSGYMMRVLAKSKDEDSYDEGSDQSDGDGDNTDQGRLPFFRPIDPVGEGPFIAELAPFGDIAHPGTNRQRSVEGFFGELGTDPALRASIQAFQETTDTMDLLRLNTTYDSQESGDRHQRGNDDDDVFEDADGGGRHQWSCTSCTFINTGGRSCEMCGTFDSGI